MSGFLVRLLIAALGLWLAQALVPGVEIHGTGTPSSPRSSSGS